MSDSIQPNVTVSTVFGPNRAGYLIECCFFILFGALIAVASYLGSWTGWSILIRPLFLIAGFTIFGWYTIGCLGVFRGLPCVSIVEAGVSIATAFDVRWAEWSSLTNFVLGYELRGKTREAIPIAKATIIGTGVSPNLRRCKEFVISNQFAASLEDIVEALNARRSPGVENYLAARVPNTAQSYEDFLIVQKALRPFVQRIVRVFVVSVLLVLVAIFLLGGRHH